MSTYICFYNTLLINGYSLRYFAFIMSFYLKNKMLCGMSSTGKISHKKYQIELKFGSAHPLLWFLSRHMLSSCMLREWRTDTTQKSPNKGTNCLRPSEISCLSVVNSVCSTCIITAFPKISLSERWRDVFIFFIVCKGSFLRFLLFLSLRKCGQTIIHRSYCIWSLNQVSYSAWFPTNKSSNN